MGKIVLKRIFLKAALFLTLTSSCQQNSSQNSRIVTVKTANTKDSNLNKETKTDVIDTIHSVTIDSINEHKVYYLYDRSSNREYLQTTQSNHLVNVPQEEIKNLTFNSIYRISNGFCIDVSWGGGNDIYRSKLRFRKYDLDYLLYKTECCHVGPNKVDDMETITTKREINFKDLSLSNILKMCYNQF